MTGKLFVYENIRVAEDRKSVDFDYRVDTNEQSFSLSEQMDFPTELPNNSTTDKLLRALHIALGISYYKTFIPPEINHAYEMSESEANFWNTIFNRGLGEFLYENKLEPSKLAKFKAQEGQIKIGSDDETSWSDTALLGVGGGKDSIVAGELLKKIDIKLNGFVLATASNRGQTQEVVNKMEIDLLAVKRHLDPQILKMNGLKGAYNGHIPISLIFALTGCLLGASIGSKYVVVANESSASIPQSEWHGDKVNHQWSKSIEFEKMFQDYIHENISSDLHYFSAARPLTSIGVAKIFTKFPKYFETFTSDNSLFRIGHNKSVHPRWSHDSPKSLSSYILLAPWMTDEELDRTFDKNFLDQSDLEVLFMGLLGESDNPILDCVGTPDELRLSLSLLSKQGRMKKCALMVMASDKQLIMPETDSALLSALDIDQDHCIPKDLSTKLLPLIEEILE